MCNKQPYIYLIETNFRVFFVAVFCLKIADCEYEWTLMMIYTLRTYASSILSIDLTNTYSYSYVEVVSDFQTTWIRMIWFGLKLSKTACLLSSIQFRSPLLHIFLEHFIRSNPNSRVFAGKENIPKKTGTEWNDRSHRSRNECFDYAIAEIKYQKSLSNEEISGWLVFSIYIEIKVPTLPNKWIPWWPICHQKHQPHLQDSHFDKPRIKTQIMHDTSLANIQHAILSINWVRSAACGERHPTFMIDFYTIAIRKTDQFLKP